MALKSATASELRKVVATTPRRWPLEGTKLKALTDYLASQLTLPTQLRFPFVQSLLTDAPAIGANELVIAKNAADALHKHYPDHLWAVALTGGMLDVRNLMLSGNWGFRLRLPAIYSATDFDRQVMRAGGEILERYRVHRRRADMEALGFMPVNFAGQHAFDR